MTMFGRKFNELMKIYMHYELYVCFNICNWWFLILVIIDLFSKVINKSFTILFYLKIKGELNEKIYKCLMKLKGELY